MLNGGVLLHPTVMSATNPSEVLSHRLAEALNENESLRIACRALTEQLDAAEEIIMRLQSKDLTWEPPNETAHHLNHH